MAQTIALQTRSPLIDPAAPLMAAEQYRGRQIANEGQQISNRMSGLQLGEAEAEVDALRAYREAVESGDKNALGKLKGFPELQARFFKAIDSMKPDERAGAQKRAAAFADVARTVMGMEAGPAQAEAWNRGIQQLVQGGFITPEMGEEQIRQGPNQLIMYQALEGEQLMKLWSEKHGKGEEELEGLDPKALNDINQRVEDFRKNYYGGSSSMVYLDAEKIAARDAAADAFRQRLMDEAQAATPAGRARARQQPDRGNVLDLTPRESGPVAPAKPQAPGLYSPEPMATQGGDGGMSGMSIPDSHRGAPTVETPEDLKALDLDSGTPVIVPGPNGPRFVYTK